MMHGSECVALHQVQVFYTLSYIFFQTSDKQASNKNWVKNRNNRQFHVHQNKTISSKVYGYSSA